MAQYGLLLLFALVSQLSFALNQSPVHLHKILDKSIALELAKHPTWHKLMHYEPDFFSSKGVKSAIHSEDFFNSPGGIFDPEAELLATLIAFFKPLGNDPNKHAQCIFRARFLWLKENLPIDDSALPQVNCSSFQDWSFNGSTTSISIVLATGYLGNPASYYGHMLLKLNSTRHSRNINLLDVSINFGAIVPHNEDPVSYIVKGLIGGYDAGFSHIEYYFHTHNYGESELRDLWEYELNLTQKQVDLIVAHVWEVLGKHYTYYFLEKNCAYRMAELLELVEGVKITHANKPWFMPQELIKKIDKENNSGKPLIRNIKYYPSRQSRLYSRYTSLDKRQRRWVHKIVRDIFLLENPRFIEEPLESKQLILDTLLDYYQFARKTKSLPTSTANSNYNKALAYRFQLPPGKRSYALTQPESPHTGRDPSLFSTGYLENSVQGRGALFTLRPAYYDDLDADHAHVKNAELTMGKITIEAFDDGLKLRDLDIVNVKNVRENTTGLPGDKSASWKLQLGLKNQNLECTHNCLVARFRADTGYTVLLTDTTLIGGYVGIGMQDNRNKYGNLFLSSSAFVKFNALNNLNVRFSIEHREHVDGILGKEMLYGIVARYQLNKEWDFRIKYQKNQVEETALLLGYYW